MKTWLTTLAQQIDTSHIPKTTADPSKLSLIFNTVIGMFGAVALLVLVIAGLRYVTSAGDPASMTKSKNTIIYASVGLIVAMSAFVIVNFSISHI